MQFVPATRPRSAWRVVILLLAALLTLGVLAPMTASATGSPALLGVKDKRVVEPDFGYKTVPVKIFLNHRVGHKVNVAWATRDGTAKAWRDYKPTHGRAFFDKWQKAAFAFVKVIGDRKVEPDEFFKVKIFDAHGAVIADRFGRVTIVNDDLPGLTIADDKVVAGDKAKFDVCLTTTVSWDVTFSYKTKDKTAVAPGDYEAVTLGSGKIDKGTKCTTVKVQTNKDGDALKEKFIVKVFDVKGAVVLDGKAKGIIKPL